MATSIFIITSIISCFILAISFERKPSNCFIPFLASLSDFALITSITDSACNKSILPFKNALFVNSPGSASSAPFFKHNSNIFFTTTFPPCELISHIFSVV